MKSYSAYFVRAAAVEQARAVFGASVQPLPDSPWLLCAYQPDDELPDEDVLLGETSLTQAKSEALGEVFFVYGSLLQPEKCEAAEAFTPVDVTVSDLGSMTVCAYSGCWSGKGKVLKSGAHVIISANKLKWSGTSPNSATFIVGIDKTDNVAVIKGSNFAMPLICKSGGA